MMHPIKNPFSMAVIAGFLAAVIVQGDKDLYWIPAIASIAGFFGTIAYYAWDEKKKP